MNELVSIIMPTRLDRSALNGAINSILAQDHQNWEIILAVNNSLVPVVRSDFYPDPRIHMLDLGKLPHDYGTTARMLALAEAKGEYICTLDDDDWYEPSFLSTMLTFEERLDDADIVYCRSRLIDRQTDQPCGSWLFPWHEGVINHVAFILSNTIMVRRALYEHVHLNPAAGYNSDWTFYADAAAHGAEFYSLDKLLSNARVDDKAWHFWAAGGYSPDSNLNALIPGSIKDGETFHLRTEYRG